MLFRLALLGALGCDALRPAAPPLDLPFEAEAALAPITDSLDDPPEARAQAWRDAHHHFDAVLEPALRAHVGKRRTLELEYAFGRLEPVLQGDRERAAEAVHRLQAQLERAAGQALAAR